MIDKLKNIFIIPELASKNLFTIAILIVVRIGSHIPIPGVDGEALAGAFSNMKNTLFGLFNTFVGGAFEKASLFSLGIMPYISSSNYYSINGISCSIFSKIAKRGRSW